jgi:hypothetical protein
MKTWRSYVCRHITEQGAPICSVYQGDDHLQVLCDGGEDVHGDGSVVVESWGCVVKRDASLLVIEDDLDPGVWCYRDAPGAPWQVQQEEQAA